MNSFDDAPAPADRRRQLTDGQIAAFHRDGTLGPLPLLDAAGLAAIHGPLRKLMATSGLDQHSGYLTQLHLHLDWVRRLATLPRLLDTIEDLLGPNLLVHASSLFCKLPGDGASVHWHQDGYFLGLDRPELVTAWVALTPATRANGCLQVVPGSHHGGPRPHRTRWGSEHSMLKSGMELVTPVDPDTARDVTLRAGQMALHQVDLAHGSAPNRSDAPRIGLALRFVPAGLGQRTPHHAVLLARGDDPQARFEHYRQPAVDDPAIAVAASATLMEQTMRDRGHIASHQPA